MPKFSSKNSRVLLVFISQKKYFVSCNFLILQSTSGESGGKSGIGSLFTWVSSGGGAALSSALSLLTKSSGTEVPWFALTVLICEAQEEIDSGLWKALLKEMNANPTITVETAIKVSKF